MSPVSDSADRRPASVDDYAACLNLLCVGSKSFHAASRLLPARLRPAVHALYAFCRLADDAVDESLDRRDGLARMQMRVAAIYDGSPLSAPVDLAFADVVQRFGVPRSLPEALFEGFAWDVAGRRYQTLSEVRAYAMRVAGTVGAMMALLMEVRSASALARACDLGVAMQLTNIARDIGEDARAGRLYLPLDWFDEVGLNAEAWLAAPVFCPQIGLLTSRLLAEADRLYARADGGIAQLPADCRAAISSARHIYHAIGIEIARNDYDSVSRRAHVSKTRKLALIGWAVTVARAKVSMVHPCLPEARFLVEAIDWTGVKTGAVLGTQPQRIGWLIDLFARLEQMDREGRRAGAGIRTA